MTARGERSAVRQPTHSAAPRHSIVRSKTRLNRARPASKQSCPRVGEILNDEYPTSDLLSNRVVLRLGSLECLIWMPWHRWQTKIGVCQSMRSRSEQVVLVEVRIKGYWNVVVSCSHAQYIMPNTRGWSQLVVAHELCAPHPTSLSEHSTNTVL